ncbi:MAG: hypothetical protein ACRD2C_05810 [Acidimicrobiales bacterium]
MRRRILVLAIAVALIGGACGDDDGGILGNAGEGQGDAPALPGGAGGAGSAGEGGGSGYTDATRANFITTCATYPGASNSLCECAWNGVVQSVPYEQYQEFESAIAQDPSTPLPGFVMDAVSACS